MRVNWSEHSYPEAEMEGGKFPVISLARVLETGRLFDWPRPHRPFFVYDDGGREHERGASRQSTAPQAPSSHANPYTEERFAGGCSENEGKFEVLVLEHSSSCVVV